MEVYRIENTRTFDGILRNTSIYVEPNTKLLKFMHRKNCLLCFRRLKIHTHEDTYKKGYEHTYT